MKKLNVKAMIDKQIEQLEYNKKHGIISDQDKMYLDLVKPTYIENWHNELMKFSIPTKMFKISLNEVENLLGAGEGKYKGFNRNNIPEDFLNIFNQLNNLLPKFENGSFVRLGSRSPKEVYMHLNKKEGIKDSFEAVAVLLESMRVFEDLCFADRVRYEPYIVLREWLNIEPWREFRCFSKNGQIRGISQYFYNDYFPNLIDKKDEIEKAIHKKYNEFKNYLPECVVFDIIVLEDDIKLLEINPYNKEGRQYTDPCLFNWNEIQNGDYEFRIVEKETKSTDEDTDFFKFLNNLK